MSPQMDLRWANEEIAILQEMWPLYTRQQIAARLKRSMQQISRKAHHLKLSGKPKRSLPQSERFALARAKYLAQKEQKGETKRTPERRLILERDWPTFRQAFEIVAEMNALPGLKITREDLGSWAKTSGLKRPPEFRPRRAPDVPRSPPKIEAKAAAPTIPRTCLDCQRPFEAPTRFIRLCSPCKGGR